MPEEIYAQFTEDKAASQPIQCGRIDCGQMINPGDPRHVIRNRNPNGLRKIVCDGCRRYYLTQPTTVRVDTRQPTIAAQAQEIHRNVIDARGKDATRSQRRVTAIPEHPVHQGSASMPPPPVPLGYPHVAVPSSWGRSMSFPAPPSQWNGTSSHVYPRGYSDAHAHYPAQREAWASRAYQSSPAETIGIIMQVLREIPGKFKGQIIQNLVEGKPNIPASATPPYLIGRVIETMKPKLMAVTRGYPFDYNRLIIREVAGWIDLAGESPDHPYFYDRCLVNPSIKAKDKGRVFKKPKNPFILALVIDSEQWEKYLDYAVELDAEEVIRENELSMLVHPAWRDPRPCAALIKASIYSQWAPMAEEPLGVLPHHGM
ncbi:hypothetical protein GGX14DRAFT_392581 [Mycena pura]|uniref:Uncharacterized protein n=1 Tax=Mycena pura TaxID=153505 RepID=A0AAD6YFR7_9AGAR|nr:hypothetical protein GGX14DRAFT_392581 [Mycena pura]